MSTFEVFAPFPVFFGLDGKPLDGGYIYIGIENLDPETNQKQAFWDSDLLITASQPIRTQLGCPIRSGSPSGFFTNGSYSITVKDLRGQIVFTRLSVVDSTGDLLRDLIDSSDINHGDAMIAVKQPFIGSSARTQHLKNAEFVSVTDFTGCDPTGVNDSSAAFQAAVNAHSRVYIPAGTYLINTQIQLNNGNYLFGDGWGYTILKHTVDSRVLTSSSATTSTAVYDVVLDGFMVESTVTGATTKYDIHLYNPNNTTIRNVRVKSGHNDAAYSNTNLGGILLDKPSGSTATSFMNLIENCWVQNNSIYLNNCTDSTIRGGWVWGHVRGFAIRIGGTSSGNISVEGVNGIISSQYNGGIWIDGANINQIRIVGCEHDGNPSLTRGDFIYSPQTTNNVIVTGNTIWAPSKRGINVTDPNGWVVTGNNFWKCNDADNSYDDILVTGSSFSPNRNVFSCNTHVCDTARTNKGYAYREVNAGSAPVNNLFSSNGISGVGYQAAQISPSLQNGLLGLYSESSWTPAFTGLTETGGSATKTGGYIRIGNFVKWWAKITPVTSTTSAGGLSTNINNLPFTNGHAAELTVFNDTTVATIGQGIVGGSSTNAYLPAWTGVTAPVVICGSMFLP